MAASREVHSTSESMDHPLNKHRGHIKRIYMRNVGNFKGDNIINISGENLPASIVSFVGENNTGKRTIMRCIATINIFRHRYQAFEYGEGLRRLKRIDTDYSYPMDCDDSCKPGGPCFQCEKTIQSSDVTLEKLLTEFNVHPNDIHKFEKDKHGLVVVETTDRTASDLVYYGLYAKGEDPGWYWHHRIQDGHYKYSCVFLLHPADRILFVLDGSYLDRGENPIKRFNLDEDDKPDRAELLRWMGEFIHNHLGNVHKQMEDLDRLPERFIYLFPTIVCTQNIIQRNTLDVKNRYDSPAFVKNILEQSSDFDFKPTCFLLDNPIARADKRRQEDYLEHFSSISKQNHIQIVMTVYSEYVLESTCVDSVVRFWMTSNGAWKAQKVPRKFLSSCMKQEWRPYELLTSNSVVIVEGKSDANVMRALLKKIEESEIKVNQDAENKAGLELLKRSHVCAAGGKNSLGQVMHILLENSMLGFFPWIICDGDALTGGSAELMSEDIPDSGDSPDDSFHKSALLSPDKKSVLYNCIKFLQTGPKSLKVLYHQLLDSSCKDTSLNCVLYSDKTGDYGNIVKEVLEYQCQSYKKAWLFSEKCLHGFAWKRGKCDLESALRLTCDQRDISKSQLSENRKLVKELVKSTISDKNQEIFRLLHFIIQTVLSNFNKYCEACFENNMK